MTKLNEILEWQLKKPKNNKDWAEDVKKENLDVKYDFQLSEMEKSHADKIPKVEDDLYKFEKYPDVIRYELEQQFKNDFKGEELTKIMEEEFESQHNYYKWKKAKLDQSVERIKKERKLRASGFVVADKGDDKKLKDVSKIAEDKIRHILGTTYYVDFDNGNDLADGLTPTGDATNGPWATLDKFTENARSAGDVCIVRRGMTQTVSSDLLFTSDGTIVAPITIEAAYANEWSDNVDLSATATATLIFGSKTITFSADVSGVLAAGDFIYASGDAAKEFAYEVASVDTVTVTLYLPYKGNQAGSGKTIINMQDAPIWNIAAGDFQWNFDGDSCWKTQGIHIRGTDLNGQIELDGGSFNPLFKDCIFEGNGSGDYGLKGTDDDLRLRIYKSRFYNNYAGIGATGGSGAYEFFIKDCLFDGNSAASGMGIRSSQWMRGIVIESEFKNHAAGDIQFNGWTASNILLRNCILSSATEIDGHQYFSFITKEVFSEDHDGVIGDNRQLTNLSIAEGTPTIQSENTTVRSGGATKSIKVTPSINLGSIWEYSKLLLFEIPIYATTASKTYTIYFNLPDANFTVDPTAAELWIELEAWGHASNNHRKITKSVGTITSDGTWRALTVTVASAQAGVAYLKCYYCKTKEAASNIFYVDPVPLIT